MKNYWSKNISDWRTYIRSYGEGVGFPSRRWLARHLERGVSLLDVGCGGGIEYENLVAEGRQDVRYAGCDYTPEAIEASRDLFPGVAFSVADARDLADFADRSFDVVLLRHTLDHIDRWEDALRAAYRVAAKEVVVILWPTTFDDNREPTLQDKGDDGWFRQFSSIGLTNWIATHLGPDSVTITLISAKDVPGREHRLDTAFVIKKKV